ncbi:unnamed protein product [Lymnaea stagnalis]|uniref:Uncharacterized protein n=1 Tax=Lymnaea stagnalis TaxID=6523 RepID=A0AAV2I8R0_LYMST
MTPRLLAWGNSGALGLGATERHTQTGPQNVHSMEKIEIRKISTGETHTLVCANDGSLYSCGSNAFKQCGREGSLSQLGKI